LSETAITLSSYKENKFAGDSALVKSINGSWNSFWRNEMTLVKLDFKFEDVDFELNNTQILHKLVSLVLRYSCHYRTHTLKIKETSARTLTQIVLNSGLLSPLLKSKNQIDNWPEWMAFVL
jgi:hypothetical protein